MRSIFLLLTMGLLIPASTAHAQPAPQEPQHDSQRCAPVALGRVVVRMLDRTERRGTLVCLTAEEVTLLAPGGRWAGPTRHVLEIVKPGDPVWDGALKGLAFSAFFAVACGGDCPASGLLRATAFYVGLGTVIDAANTHREVLYGSATRRLSFISRVRF